MDRIADVLDSVRRKGVRIWTEQGQLRYQAPKGALTPQEVDRLRQARSQIVALLETTPNPDDRRRSLADRARSGRGPLAFSQQMYWNMFQLGERGARRQVASATRLSGPLRVEAFRASIAEAIRRHDALRTRIVVSDETPAQEIADSVSWRLKADDLSPLTESRREREVQRLIETDILEPIDLAVDPLFGVRLIKLREEEHVLVIVLEHIISDALSLQILLGEILKGYAQIERGQALSLPEIALQFADYAARQRQTHDAWLQKHSAYWDRRLEACQRLRFPETEAIDSGSCVGWGTVPIRIDGELKRELQAWCRSRRNTLVMSVLTVYVALVLRWCNASAALFQYEFEGRVTPAVANTIGYFASALYLRVGLLRQDSFIDLLSRVTAEYCRAYEHADLSWMASQMPRPQFARNTVFNWVPQATPIDPSGRTPSQRHPLTWHPVPFDHPVARTLDVDNEPSMLLFDMDDGIVGGMYFPRKRFAPQTMERFTHNFLALLKALLREPATPVMDVPLS